MCLFFLVSWVLSVAIIILLNHLDCGLEISYPLKETRALICISLIADNTEHLFICLRALYMSSLEKCLFKSFAHFLIELLVFLEWSHVSSLYILEIKPLSEVSLANVFPYGWFSFHFNAVFFSHAEAFYFNEVPLIYSFLYVPCFRGHVCEDVAAWNV